MSYLKVTFYSVVPSPYQRDIFYQLSCLPEIEINVFYLEQSISDSPWPEKPLQPYEKILPGTHLRWGASRFQLNWHLPDLANTDVVVLNGYQNSVAQIILHTWAHQIPCIFWGEKMVANSAGLKGQLQTFLATGLKNCRAIAAIGSRAVKDYQQRLPEMPIFNIPYYCSLEKFGQSLPERPRDPVTILFCGQMIRRKGVDLLLKAFENLVQSGFKARLLLVGREAELPQMLKLIDPKIQSQIHYAGFQAPENLPQFFQQADIFVLPSRYDGWGVVVNQALGAGLPIICSDQVGAAYDLIEPGINGEIFPSGDVKVLTQAMKTFLKKPGYIQLASQFSIKKSQGWHLEIGAQRWLNVLQNI